MKKIVVLIALLTPSGVAQARGTDAPSGVDVAAAVPQPEPDVNADGRGTISGTVIMPNKIPAQNIHAIACSVSEPACQSKFVADMRFNVGPVGFFNIAVQGERFHVYAWKDEDGNGRLSAGDYWGIAQNGDEVPLIVNVGGIEMARVTKADF